MDCDINHECLKLAQITYGGELYYSLQKYCLKDITLPKGEIEKTPDGVLKKNKDNTYCAYKNEDSGFAANVFENSENGKIIIAYRGTERTAFGENAYDFIAWGKDIMTDINLITGIVDRQFEDAKILFDCVKEQNPEAEIIITGHSLGGGLSQMISAKAFCERGIRFRTYTYNAPGCKHLLKAFGCKENNDYSFIKNYAVMNDWCGMFGENIGETYLIAPIPMNEADKNHPGEVLNNILLTSHEGIFDYSEEKYGKIIRKPDDFNQDEGLSLWYFDKNNPIKDTEKIQDFIKSVTPKFNLPEIPELKKTLKEAAEKFVKEHPSFLPEIDASQISEEVNKHYLNLRENIKNSNLPDGVKQNLLIIEQNIKEIDLPDMSKIVEPIKEKIDEIKQNIRETDIKTAVAPLKENIEKFKENLPEITLRDAPEPVKAAAEKLILAHSACRDKFLESIKNNVIASLSSLLETSTENVSQESLNRAITVLKRELSENEQAYLQNLTAYLPENSSKPVIS